MRSPYQLLPVLHALQVLLLPLLGLVLLLQERLDGFILSVEVAHVLQDTHSVSHTHRRTHDGNTRSGSDTHGHQVFHHIHVRQRVDLRHFAGVAVDFVQTRQRVSAVDVHGARSTDSCRPDRNRIRTETHQNEFKRDGLPPHPLCRSV